MSYAHEGYNQLSLPKECKESSVQLLRATAKFICLCTQGQSGYGGLVFPFHINARRMRRKENGAREAGHKQTTHFKIKHL
ncbi:hypothetical protein EVAR_48167_1 [Eumeta japonica]|uniref:Uncharacterized protein n=1 Tax=Eumeta variegata TaxID=151549 RepID=A0A4C1WTI5_EUMVA|nr:hypothetical protein EVAR_48167_1 [Eumeta japonica]